MKNIIECNWLEQEFRAKYIKIKAANLMNKFLYLVIWGIYNYANSHKNNI